MKLLIKKKYWEMIERGEKHFEYRDAHITFIDNKTKKVLGKKEILDVDLLIFEGTIKNLHKRFPDCLNDIEPKLRFLLK